MRKYGRNPNFRFNYPLKQFCSHFSAMTTVQTYDEVRLDYDSDKEPLNVGSDHDLMANSLRVMDYMAQHIKDKEERIYKSSMLIHALYYLTRYRRRFFNAGLWISGSGRENNDPAFVSESLLRAFHNFYLVEGIENVDPRRLIRLAKIYEKEEGN